MKILSLILVVGASLASGLQPIKPTQTVAKPGQWTVAVGSRLFSAKTEGSETSSAATTEWTKPRIHNSLQFRSAALLGVLAIAGVKAPSGLLSSKATGTLHLLSFASWFGMVFYTTFIAGITMFKNLPRQTFGKLQAKLFPKYFALSSVFLVLQLVTLKGLALGVATSTKALGVALAMTLLNQFYLEPTSTANMMERYELEDKKETDTDHYKKLKANFGKFHGMSSLTNLIALCGGVAHAVYLAAGLV